MSSGRGWNRCCLCPRVHGRRGRRSPPGHAAHGALGHPNDLQPLRAPVPDREDELVAKLDSRHARALGPSREAKGRQDQENAFEFSLSSKASRAPRASARRDESRPDQGKRSVGPDGFEPSTSPLSGVRSNRAELWAPVDVLRQPQRRRILPFSSKGNRGSRTRVGPRFDRGPRLPMGVCQRPRPATI